MCLISVTVGTAIFQVLAEQRVTRCVVIELDLKPVIRVVAISAGIAKKILMHVVFEVAVHTSIGRTATFHIRCVTPLAISLAVLAV